MTVRLLRKDKQTCNIIPLEHGKRETQFTVSISEPSITKQLPIQDEDVSSVDEDSSTSCLTKEYSIPEHESMTKSEGILPTGGLDNYKLDFVNPEVLCTTASIVNLDGLSMAVSEHDLRITTNEATHMEEEVTSTWVDDYDCSS